MNRWPHIILETANFHGGDPEILKEAIERFGGIAGINYPNLGIKFHAFKPDNVVLEDFSWYPVVKRFGMDENQWAEIICLAREKHFHIWLDLFCVFGVEILEKHFDNIFGLKLQPSILDNREILEALEKLNGREGFRLDRKELILNVSGLELMEIETAVATFGHLGFKKITLQLGFQNYPTKIEDTSLKKIDVLKSAFPHLELAYGDHIDARMPFSRRFPVYAWLRGCSYLEKHICLDREKTEFDSESALEPEEVKEIADEIRHIRECFTAPFISGNEEKYYRKTIQKPVLAKPLRKGQLIAPSDVIFRRTDRPGLNIKELTRFQEQFHILDRDMAKLETVSIKDYKKPRVAVIVAARMKSSRLKQKAILPIQGMSSIERCLDNCLKFPNVDEVILATSTLEEDAVLKDRTLDGKVKFWQGDPDDVISRYLGACDKYGIDVVVRLTGDSPVVSPEIGEIILDSHFKSGADFTEVKNFAVGTNSQVYNVEALKHVMELVGKADYSEHMTLYLTNNPHIFKLNFVTLPAELDRDYRLTLDYPEDLEMFNRLFEKLNEADLDAHMVNVFNILDQHPEIAQINSHRSQVYKTDENLIRLLNEKTTIKI